MCSMLGCIFYFVELFGGGGIGSGAMSCFQVCMSSNKVLRESPPTAKVIAMLTNK